MNGRPVRKACRRAASPQRTFRRDVDRVGRERLDVPSDLVVGKEREPDFRIGRAGNGAEAVGRDRRHRMPHPLEFANGVVHRHDHAVDLRRPRVADDQDPERARDPRRRRVRRRRPGRREGDSGLHRQAPAATGSGAATCVVGSAAPLAPGSCQRSTDTVPSSASIAVAADAGPVAGELGALAGEHLVMDAAEGAEAVPLARRHGGVRLEQGPRRPADADVLEHPRDQRRVERRGRIGRDGLVLGQRCQQCNTSSIVHSSVPAKAPRRSPRCPQRVPVQPSDLPRAPAISGD